MDKKTLIKILNYLSQQISVYPFSLDKIFIVSLNKIKLINYLAEMGEVSPTKVKDILTVVGLTELSIANFIGHLSKGLIWDSEDEVARALFFIVDEELFLKNIQINSSIPLSQIKEIFNKTKFRDIVYRYQLKNIMISSKDIGDFSFKNHPQNSYNPDSSTLAFSKGRIQFIGFGSPEILCTKEEYEVVDKWCKVVQQDLRDEPKPIFKDKILKKYYDFFHCELPDLNSENNSVALKYGVIESNIIQQYIIHQLRGLETNNLQNQQFENAWEEAQERIKYVITFGIGGNEMRWHTLSELNNQLNERKWIPIHSADQINLIPDDASSENTITFSFSRGGNTEETKGGEEVLHERFPHSIIYANRGELLELGKVHDALILPFPRRISGRYCGLVTSINLAPMYVLGMDTKRYWEISDRADKSFSFNSEVNPAWEIAKFIFIEKVFSGVKMIYLGHNHHLIEKSLNELSQYIMEGLAKEGNELFSMVGMKYPRSSHYEIEGPLGNPHFFLFWNTLLTEVRTDEKYQYKFARNPQKQKLYADEINGALLAANLITFSKNSPCIAILLEKFDIETSAILSKLYEDTIYLLCRLCNVDPFGNPSVKQVRDTSEDNVRKLFEYSKDNIPKSRIIYELIHEAFG